MKKEISNRMSERASRDPKICEILVRKVESKDLGDWRSILLHFVCFIDYIVYILINCFIE